MGHHHPDGAMAHAQGARGRDRLQRTERDSADGEPAAVDRGVRRQLQRARLDVTRRPRRGGARRRPPRTVCPRSGRQLHPLPHAGRRQRCLARLVLV